MKNSQEDFVPTYDIKTAADKKNLELYGYEMEKKPKLPFTYEKEGNSDESNPLSKKISG